ncbi:MAG: hypothetical protein HYY68_04050 [Thaumarchaeota archaeon]|nr:hypothetical protein [Nitrososphaerota archaeon]
MSAVRVPDVPKSIARLRSEDIEGMLRVAAISPGATREMIQSLQKLLELKELLGEEREPSDPLG